VSQGHEEQETPRRDGDSHPAEEEATSRGLVRRPRRGGGTKGEKAEMGLRDMKAGTGRQEALGRGDRRREAGPEQGALRGEGGGVGPDSREAA
jgi:hypothetical protein